MSPGYTQCHPVTPSVTPIHPNVTRLLHHALLVTAACGIPHCNGSVCSSTQHPTHQSTHRHTRTCARAAPWFTRPPHAHVPAYIPTPVFASFAPAATQHTIKYTPDLACTAELPRPWFQCGRSAPGAPRARARARARRASLPSLRAEWAACRRHAELSAQASLLSLPCPPFSLQSK